MGASPFFVDDDDEEAGTDLTTSGFDWKGSSENAADMIAKLSGLDASNVVHTCFENFAPSGAIFPSPDAFGSTDGREEVGS